jgi:hypothetical protein
MRMDIENSPGAPAQRIAAARDYWGPERGKLAAGDGVMGEKCLCRMPHPATVCGERRFIEERTKGVL